MVLIGGLVILVFGGDLLVRGAVGTARAWRVSPMVIGLTLVGFGTSTPELAASLQAVLSGAPDLAVGNVLGSNIANLLLIIAAAALVRPMLIDPAALRRDGGVLVLVTLAGGGLVALDGLDRVGGAALLCGLVVYLVWTLRRDARHPEEAAAALHASEAEGGPKGPTRPWLALALVIIGIAATVVGAKLLVMGAIDLARDWGVTEKVIGLTIVAIGTSLPELTASVIAAARRQGEVALGNVIGSNIFNILCILGVSSVTAPFGSTGPRFLDDILVMGASTLLVLLFAWRGRGVSRREGGVLLALYGAYMVWLS